MLVGVLLLGNLALVAGCIDGSRTTLDATEPNDTLDGSCTLVCEDASDPCASIALDAVACVCASTPVPDYTPCDDGNACTWSDRCLPGRSCEGLALDVATDCDDANACTEDACDPAVGCVHTPLADAACDDDNPCTAGERCDAGRCEDWTDYVCGACDVEADTCETDNGDGDPCNGALVCRDGMCLTDDATRVRCSGAVLGECTVSVCDPALGVCRDVGKPDDTVCSDGVPCTVGDRCGAGTCAGVTLLDAACSCGRDQDCDDLEDDDLCNGRFSCDNQRCTEPAASRKVCPDSDPNGCVDNRCDPADGFCKPEAVSPRPCDDANPCTVSTACNGLGVCLGDTLDCSDLSSDCSTGHCDPGVGCVTAPRNAGGSCEDGTDRCAETSVCDAGQCVAARAIACDDDDACTTDSCDPGVGCVFLGPQPPLCSSEGVCADGVPRVCEGEAYRCAYEAVANYSVVEVCDGLDNDCDGVPDEDCVATSACAVGAATAEYDGLMQACQVSPPVPAEADVCGPGWVRCTYIAYLTARGDDDVPAGFLLAADIQRTQVGVWSAGDAPRETCVEFEGACGGAHRVQAVTFDGLYMGTVAYAAEAWLCSQGVPTETCESARFDGAMCCRAECATDEQCADDSPCTTDSCDNVGGRCVNERPTPPSCPQVGVCAAGVPYACQSDGMEVCNFGAVANWEPTETLCDGLDNDCNGSTDPGNTCSCADSCEQCGGGSCCDVTCEGGDCGTCMGGCLCRWLCFDGGCSGVCQSDSICEFDVSVTRGNDLTCRNESRCTVDALNASALQVECENGSDCEVSCKNGDDCKITRCKDNARCLIDCKGATDCDLQGCESGPLQTCPGDVLVCNRPCP